METETIEEYAERRARGTGSDNWEEIMEGIVEGYEFAIINNKYVTRVELISYQNGREKVIKTDDIELSFQDDGRTLKIFYGYGKLDNLKHFTKHPKLFFGYQGAEDIKHFIK